MSRTNSINYYYKNKKFMLFFNEKEIKSKRTLTIEIKNLNSILDSKMFTGNLNILYDWYKFDHNLYYISHIISYLNDILINKLPEKQTHSFYINNNNFIDIDRLLNFLDFRKEKLTDTKSDRYFELMYGGNWKEIKEKELSNRKIHMIQNMLAKEIIFL